MARRPEPWRRKGAGNAWYAQVAGKQEFLAPATATKTEATAALNQKLGDPKAPRSVRAPGLTVQDVVNLFLDHTRREVARGDLKPVTLQGYERFLDRAAVRLGHLGAAAIRAKDVRDWVDADPPGWGATTRYNAVTALKAALNWAKRSGHIEVNPIAAMERPTPRRREEILTAGQVNEMLDKIRDVEFRDLITAMRETGCRPGEVCGLTAAMVDLAARTWTVENKTRRRTREPTRTVYLSDVALELSRRLVTAHPAGPLFRNTKGSTWTRWTIAHRMGRLAKALGMGPEAVVYSLRHLFITDGLERGIPPATLAELAGHSDVAMIMRVYNKLKKRTDHLHEAVRKVRP